jgi:hypothetical protein
VIRRPLLLAATLSAVLACLAPAAGAQVAAPSQPAGCPSFQVLRNDRIGALALPAGAYAMTVGTPATLTCAQAADLFRQFLQDFDGRLHGGWRVDAATSSFSRAGGTQAFSVSAGVPSTPLTPAVIPSGEDCPGTFAVVHDDRVGTLAIPAGAYTITLVASGRMTCAQAVASFASFLRDYDGRLPGAWTLDPETGTFLRGSANVGFRIEPAAPAPASPGAQVAPLPLPLGGAPCPGTFRVLHDDRVGRLTLSAGRYLVAPLSNSSLSCADTSSLLRRFLAAAGDRLPAPWTVSRATGTFTRGRGSDVGFRVKPVS